ncbi:MAG: 50S ribosomal protein L5 [Promethearchaeota archaeon]|nr:MAG: 50S ribosomal protein L5 [Candidatus Lokiarchaeota archaeon]
MSLKDVDYKSIWKKNPMLMPFVDKLVINIGVGKGGEELQKAAKVLEGLVDAKPVMLTANKNVKEWGVRKGQSIATKVTLRGQAAVDFLLRALVPFDNRILRKAFDNKGNFSFGIDEHIKLPDVKYDPELGIFGFNVTVRVSRPGYRIKIRKKDRRSIGQHHYLNKQETMYFAEKELKIEVVDVMEERYY